MKLKSLCSNAHKIAKQNGFWEDKNIPTKLMLVVTELAEACEADRNNDNQNFNEEIADTFIRLADLCGFLQIDIEKEIERKMKINEKRIYKHGKRY